MPSSYKDGFEPPRYRRPSMIETRGGGRPDDPPPMTRRMSSGAASAQRYYYTSYAPEPPEPYGPYSPYPSSSSRGGGARRQSHAASSPPSTPPSSAPPSAPPSPRPRAVSTRGEGGGGVAGFMGAWLAKLIFGEAEVRTAVKNASRWGNGRTEGIARSRGDTQSTYHLVTPTEVLRTPRSRRPSDIGDRILSGKEKNLMSRPPLSGERPHHRRPSIQGVDSDASAVWEARLRIQEQRLRKLEAELDALRGSQPSSPSSQGSPEPPAAAPVHEPEVDDPVPAESADTPTPEAELEAEPEPTPGDDEPVIGEVAPDPVPIHDRSYREETRHRTIRGEGKATAAPVELRGGSSKRLRRSHHRKRGVSGPEAGGDREDRDRRLSWASHTTASSSDHEPRRGRSRTRRESALVWWPAQLPLRRQRRR